MKAKKSNPKKMDGVKMMMDETKEMTKHMEDAMKKTGKKKGK